MSDVAGGIGTVIEGALTGSAVEPQRGRRAARTVEGECANCGALLTGPYCNQCGQKGHVHRTLAAIGHDLMHGVLHLDGKLAHTLPLLAFKPGRLTRRYIEGERAKFVSPMAMFLFSVFAMFAVFQMVGIGVPTELGDGRPLAAQAAELRDTADEDAQDLRDRLAALPADDPQRPVLEEELRDLEAGVEGLSQLELFASGGNAKVTFSGTGVKWLDEGLIKKWKENPGLMLYKLQANGYKFSWLLIPLSIPFVWLMFAWRRRFKAYDHAVFVTYSLAFMSLLFIVMSLVGTSALGIGWAFTIFATVAPLHLYKHLKHTYDLTRFSTLWRFFALIVFILLVIVLFIQTLVVLGAF
ncbi:MAG: DUF3667 domain-containing protein [Erythrobacter sp.]|jgi:hypothetical protein|nr:DUF3667 domain-containing protein [Erythrobacter sp.]